MISGQILNAVLQNEWAWCVFIVEEGPLVFIIKDWNLSLVFFTAKKESRLQASDEWFFLNKIFFYARLFQAILGFLLLLVFQIETLHL